MIFFTETGSIYEVDYDLKRIRRLEGKTNPTPRIGTDGEWKIFESCSEIELNKSVLIHWEGSRYSVTSHVIKFLMAAPSTSND